MLSQHHFRTMHSGQPVSVLLGWDRPIGHYCMVIEYVGPHPLAAALTDAGDGEDDEPFLYSNLDEPNPFELTLADFRAKLIELGIHVQELMFEQVEIDREKLTGNRQVWYGDDGSLHEV